MAGAKNPARFDGAARRDLRHATSWYEQQREGLGARFADEVRCAVALIASAPERWPVRQGTRRYVLRRFPYTVAYRLQTDGVIVVAIAHQRLDPPSWESR